MSMTDWAINEVNLACNREKELSLEDSDYGIMCYKSALKAYKVLSEDEHSGFSWSLTSSILNRLCKGLPLIPITEEDTWNFISNGLYQCSRMSSLFKHVEDKKIRYSDNNRFYCVDVDDPKEISYYSNIAAKVFDEMFSITLPYFPNDKKYKVKCKTFLFDKNNGDFDTKAILEIITPDNEKIPVNRFFKEENGQFKEIEIEEYLERERNKVNDNN